MRYSFFWCLLFFLIGQDLPQFCEFFALSLPRCLYISTYKNKLQAILQIFFTFFYFFLHFLYYAPNCQNITTSTPEPHPNTHEGEPISPPPLDQPHIYILLRGGQLHFLKSLFLGNKKTTLDY